MIYTIEDPRGAFTCGSSVLVVLADSGPFWGPGSTSTIDDSRAAFTCGSSTLPILAESGPFRGLLVAVLGSWSDFHV